MDLQDKAVYDVDHDVVRGLPNAEVYCYGTSWEQVLKERSEALPHPAFSLIARVEIMRLLVCLNRLDNHVHLSRGRNSK